MSDLSPECAPKRKLSEAQRTLCAPGGGGGVYWRIFEIGWPDFPEILAPVGNPNFSRGPASPIPCFEGHRSLLPVCDVQGGQSRYGASTAGALLITSC